MARMHSVSAIQEILIPHQDRLRRVMWPVWPRYQADIAESARLTFDATTEANILYDLAKANVLKEFAEVPGVFTVDEFTFYLVFDGLPAGIDGQVACRIKKMDLAGHSRNFPTELAKAVRRNSSRALELETMATIVDIGYVLHPLGIGFSRVQAIRVADEAFIFEIPREEGGAIQMPTPLHPREGQPGQKKLFEITPRKEGSPTDPKSKS
jgi:hypothetical protein